MEGKGVEAISGGFWGEKASSLKKRGGGIKVKSNQEPALK